jgi:hypothetical protein
MTIEAMKAVKMVYANTTKHDWPDDIWDAICQAIESEKQQPSGDKYTSYGLMGGDKFVNEDSLKRNIT